MNQELINFIRQLSVDDKKLLMQKALKTTEEVGELAKAILPYGNASGTLHRFTTRENILENVVDVYLSAISIAYQLKFTDEQIEEMIQRKVRKWSMLQANEKDIKFPLPFEIHITVERPDNIELFKQVCKDIGVKPIIIELEKSGDLVMSDVMTSSIHYGDNESVLKEADRISFDLSMPHEYFTNDVDTTRKWADFKVLRTKIETVPWHPAAPNLLNKFDFKPGNYFESHLRILTTIDRKKELERIAYDQNAHLSRNFFKKIDDEHYIIMMTLRSSDLLYEDFKAKVAKLVFTLKLNNFHVDKQEVEFAIFDSNQSHDSGWI